MFYFFYFFSPQLRFSFSFFNITYTSIRISLPVTEPPLSFQILLSLYLDCVSLFSFHKCPSDPISLFHVVYDALKEVEIIR